MNGLNPTECVQYLNFTSIIIICDCTCLFPYVTANDSDIPRTTINIIKKSNFFREAEFWEKHAFHLFVSSSGFWESSPSPSGINSIWLSIVIPSSSDGIGFTFLIFTFMDQKEASLKLNEKEKRILVWLNLRSFCFVSFAKQKNFFVLCTVRIELTTLGLWDLRSTNWAKHTPVCIVDRFYDNCNFWKSLEPSPNCPKLKNVWRIEQ